MGQKSEVEAASRGIGGGPHAWSGRLHQKGWGKIPEGRNPAPVKEARRTLTDVAAQKRGVSCGTSSWKEAEVAGECGGGAGSFQRWV